MSIADVAQLAGVSNTTVSFVINNKPGISSDTAVRVRKAMRQIGYVPRTSATKAVSCDEFLGLRTGNIGVAMADFVLSTSPFYSRLFDSIHHALDDRGLKMVPLRLSSNSQVSQSIISDIDGALLCYYFKDILEKLSVPFVSILGHPDPEDELLADHVEPANDRVGVLAAKYFISRGHKRVLAINPSIESHPAFETRVQYFTSISQKYGVKAEAREIKYLDRDNSGRLCDGSHSVEIQNFIKEFIGSDDRPTGIFLPCDSHLAVLQKCMAAAGVKPGRDVEFLGCNNEMLLLDGMDVRPATIDINPDAIARSAINVLMRRISEPETDKRIFQVVEVEPTILPAGAGVKEQW
jgi:DNA-binding LacI/PurR family transcriptional regulator